MDSSYFVGKEVFAGYASNEQHDGEYFFNDENGNSLLISVYSPSMFRFRAYPEGNITSDFSYAVDPEFEKQQVDVTITETEEAFFLKTEKLICKLIKETFQICVFDLQGRVLCQDERGMHWSENIEFGGYYVYCSKKLDPQERFYGLGDKPTDLNLRGKRFQNWGSDTYGFEKDRDPLYRNIPFYISLNQGQAYGVFFDNSFKTHFDFGAENEEIVSFWSDGGLMDYYFIYGPELISVTEQYSELTGKHCLPPLWALGYHQSKWSYYPEAKVQELAKTFRDKKIPCDALYLDIDYMDGYRCFTWHPEHFPEPKRMIQELKSNGFKTVVIIDPGIKIDKDYWVFQEGMALDHFCKRGDGDWMVGAVWPGKCHFPDFTNPDTRKWWGTLFQEFVELGVDGVWNDMNEPAVFGIETFPNDVRHDYDGNPCSHRKAHNVYGMQMVRATYEGILNLQKKKRPFTITRSGYSGLQRYASVWTGDNVATWEHLSIANVQCQRLAVSGVSFCGSDVGGFVEQPDGELFLRWIQFGVFSPFYRTHAAGDKGDQEPWTFGKEVEDLCRSFIELRYKLLPYIYTSFWQHTKFGTPILRPLVFIDQYDEKTYGRQDEFGFGDQLLICPVSESKQKSRNVYLPKSGWYHYFTDQYYEGGSEYEVDTPLNEMPIFVKSGAVLPHYPVMQYVDEFEIEILTLHVYWKDGENTTVLYQDHGENFAYQQGIYAVKEFLLQGTSNSLQLTQSKEGLFTSTYKHYEIIFHGLPFEVKKTEVIGAEEPELITKDGTTILMIRKYFKKLTIM